MWDLVGVLIFIAMFGVFTIVEHRSPQNRVLKKLEKKILE